MRFLATCNRAAVLAAVAFCVLLVVPGFRGPMVSPGALTLGHSKLFRPGTDVRASERELADADGCGVCHEPGNGTPVSKCSQCHRDLIANQHPFADDHARGRLAGVSNAFDDKVCGECHLEHALHGESDWISLNDELTRRAIGLCQECHEGTKVGPRIRDAIAATTDGGSGSGAIEVQRPIAAVPPGDPRRVSTVAFGHADHVGRDVDGDGGADVDIACAVCHVPVAAAAATTERREYAPVPYETCARCHVLEKLDKRGLEPQWAAWEKVFEKGPDGTAPAFVWNVRWHGSDDPERCHRCHESLEQRRDWHRADAIASGPLFDRLARDAERAGLKRVVRRIRERGRFDARRALYDAGRRDHAEYFEKTKPCSECHLDGSIAPEAKPEPEPFFHFMHLTQDPVARGAGDRAAANAECVACHFDRSSSNGLTDLARGSAFHWDSPAACSRCHQDGDGNELAMSPSDAHKEAVPDLERRALPDFPHGPHVPPDGKPAHPRLANGCFTCHEFAESSDGIRAHAVVETLPEMRDCRTCHAQHDEVGGGACRKCHEQEPGSFHSFWGEQPPADRPPPTRPWPGFGDFDHASRGHVAIASPTSETPDCTRCHALRESETLATVPIPSEAQAVCRECHVNPRTLRFHWR